MDNQPQSHGRGIAATLTQFYLLGGCQRWNALYTVTINFAETSVSAMSLSFDGQKDVTVTKRHQPQAHVPLVMGEVKRQAHLQDPRTIVCTTVFGFFCTNFVSMLVIETILIYFVVFTLYVLPKTNHAFNVARPSPQFLIKIFFFLY